MLCRYPVQIKDDVTGSFYYVPCGKCAWCRSQLRNEWYYRFKVEASNSERVRFVTLTYDELNVPHKIDEQSGEIVLSLDYGHVDRFLDALRRDHKHRYYLCGEYGKEIYTQRPHYHMLSFTNEVIDYSQYWPFGNVLDCVADDGALKYVTKYLLKGCRCPPGADPPKARMSRRPGIGHQFDYKGNTYLLDENGVHLKVPRYYRRKYINSLNDKLKSMVSRSAIEYLVTKDRHSDLYKLFLQSGLPDDPQHFEQWLSVRYNKDLVSQIKINQK